MPARRECVRASMDFNGPLNALSTSPSNRLIAVGGRDVLKVVALEATGFTEKRNLRVPGKTGLNLTPNDIRWHPQSEYLLATAATNGAVIIWNLEREGYKNVQERVLSGHRRAVNRICWHSTDWNVLISGSQDGTIKLWDKRGKATSTFQPKSESVRDVRTSVFQPSKFAAAFENGIVQVWDLRMNQQPELKFTAHKQLVLSIDWHPTLPNVLASGGRDRYVKIWDLSDLRQPRQTIQTIASVGRLAWRPNCVDHIATSASVTDNSIHVWDAQRPFIPVASMKGHTDTASGICWIDTPIAPGGAGGGNSGGPEGNGSTEVEGHHYWQHMLACSKDGTLKLHSLADSFKHYESLPTTALALNTTGRVAFAHDQVDRGCASLKIHRHRSASNPLFQVDAVGSGVFSGQFQPWMTPNKRGGVSTASTFSSLDGLDDLGPLDQPGNAAGLRGSSRGQQPPLPPRGLTRGISSTSNHAGVPRVSHSPLLTGQQSGSSTILTSGGGSDIFEQRLSTGSATSGGLPSPMLKPYSVGAHVPNALVSIVSLQSAVKASQLEKILHGDKDEYLLVNKQVEEMRAEFENGQHLSESFGFDEHAFRFLASNYKMFSTDGITFGQMCAHNALAAFVTGNAHLCQMWRILEVLFVDEGGAEGVALRDGHSGFRAPSIDHTGYLEQHPRRESHHHREMSLGGHPAEVGNEGNDEFANGGNQTAMLLEQLDHVNPQAMEGFDPFPYDARTLGGASEDIIPDRANGAGGPPNAHGHSTPIVNGNAVYGDMGHLRLGVLKELLEYYADTGDLQTCVTIAAVVSMVVNVEQVMGKAWMQQILMHYIDLLHQLQIYTAANDLVSNCSDPSIRQMNMKSTSIYFNCAQCSKPFESYTNTSVSSAALLCSSCSNLASRCSICQLPVRGLYVWCPVCSHGGHLEHLAEWFAHETTCPTGCSHRCSLEFAQPNGRDAL